MVTVSITRADWASKADYQSQGDFVDLRIPGSADRKMRNFFDARKGFGATRCAVNVDAAEEETELGESVDGFDVCLS